MGADPSAIDDPIVREQFIRLQAARERRRARTRSTVRQAIVLVVFVLLLCVAYTAYKAVGAAIDDAQSEWPLIGSFLPESGDLKMPPVLDIVSGIFAEPRGAGEPFWAIVGKEAAFTLREAAVGFAIGVIVGLGIAIVLTTSGRLERALVPHVIASQTIPLIAIAPIIVIWGRKSFDFLPFEWQDWMSVSIIATYLTFFPVTINGLRGLQSPRPENLELMDSYAARWGQTLWRLRLPASLPYLFAAFKIAATASVVGAIVGEISAGVKGGLGRRVLLEAQRYTTGPERLYVAVLGAAALGIFVFAVISSFEYVLVRRKGQEAVT
ncbi:ABC transporter permease [Candidatus Poriferisodalis sp.]|uniref:ABC transporter permease n=1 Tax=Candidatus Poriferisodalis sp. TaxID=3101277 RepID=UPI003B017AFE